MAAYDERMDYAHLVAAARNRVTEVDPATAAGQLDGVTIIDVREPDELAGGMIEGALAIPRGQLEASAATRLPDKTAPILVYCEVGERSALAADSLQNMGYSQVTNLGGGLVRWKAEHLPWLVPRSLSTDRMARYSRHTRLPEVGVDGQARLLESRVLVVGAGGLGSPVAMYLAAAGVGTIGIVDDDVVEISNLQRQILHGTDRLGRPKAESAAQTLGLLNPDVRVDVHRTRLDASNALDLMAAYDVVVDGTDNFPTRYLINDTSLHLGTPVVHGSIFRFEGQASVFRPYDGPCYRCLFRRPPPPDLAPSCAEAGVLGVLPGIIGSIQAAETIKLLLGIGQTLVGRLLLYDALDQETRVVRIERDPDCPACANPDEPPLLIDYDESCTAPA